MSDIIFKISDGPYIFHHLTELLKEISRHLKRNDLRVPIAFNEKTDLLQIEQCLEVLNNNDMSKLNPQTNLEHKVTMMLVDRFKLDLSSFINKLKQ